MANTNAAFGLKPVGHLLGLNWEEKIRWYVHAAADSVAIYLGDVVSLTGTSDATGVYQTVAQSAAGDTTIVGVAVGFRTDVPMYAPAALAGSNSIPRDMNYAAASTLTYVAVVDDPFVIYEAQEDSVGAALAAADVGENCDIVVGAGSTTTGLSGMQIDSSTHTSSTANLRILSLADPAAYGGNAIGTNAKWKVLINEHVYKSTTGV